MVKKTGIILKTAYFLNNGKKNSSEFFLIQLILNNDKKNSTGIFLDTAYFLNNGKKNWNYS